MTIITKTLTVLAIAATALTITSFTASDANAAGFHRGGGSVRTAAFNPGRFRNPGGNAFKYLGSGRQYSCLACHLPRPRPTHGYGWGRGWWGHGYGHGFGRGYGRGYGYYPAPVYAAPVAVAAPIAVAAQAAAPLPVQRAAANCNCLTKQAMPDGNVMLMDICTNQQAMVQPDQQAAPQQ